MSDEPKKRPRGWIGWTALALFVLYPLSVGPVTWLAHTIDPNDNGTPYRLVVILYLPLGLVAAVTRTDDAFMRYISLFSDFRL
jgi:hypothetical protein